MTWKFDHFIFLIALIWYALTAFTSIGYYHGDEHYQIIEFEGIIEGTHEAKDLAWEYKAQLRPTIQPLIAYFIFSACETLSITDPYDKAFILRLLTGLMAVFVIYFFTQTCKRIVDVKYWKPFLILSYFSWFLPFINVRFSSESWSGLALLAALGFILRDKKNFKTYLIVGLLLGLSFLFRYQVATATVGLLLWLIIIRKEIASNIIVLLSSGLFVVIAGTIIDSWFYGDFIVVPWNYLNVNLLEGKAGEYGTSPWYYYIFYVFRYSFFPFGIMIISSVFLLLFKRSQNTIIWTIIPFLLVHSILSHKELRFLFPIVNLIPLILFLAIQEIQWNRFSITFRKVIFALAMLLGIINLIGVVVASLKPAGIGRMKITQCIQDLNSSKPINLFYTEGSNPYDPWDGLSAKYYLIPSLEYKLLNSSHNSSDIKLKDEKRNLLVVKMGDLQNSNVETFIANNNIRIIEQSIPSYFTPVLKVYGYKNKDILLLFDKEKE